jgi:hydrogenase-4 component E
MTATSQFDYDVAHLLAGGVLLLSFLLLYQRRIGAVVGALAAQGALLAAAAAWQGHAQQAAGLYLTAAIAFSAKAVLIPMALRFLIRRLRAQDSVDSALGIGPTLIAGVALVGVAIAVVLPVTAGKAHALAREALAIALSVVLLGMLMLITRRHALGQVVGLLSLENGLILAAVGVAGMPLVVELSTAALVLMLAVLGGVFVTQLRHGVGSFDVAALDRHRGEAP